MKQLFEELLLTEVDIKRHEDCEHYEKCLYEAAIQKFISFTCDECHWYQPGPGLDVIDFLYRFSYDYPPSQEKGVAITGMNEEMSQKMRKAGMLVQYKRNVPFKVKNAK